MEEIAFPKVEVNEVGEVGEINTIQFLRGSEEILDIMDKFDNVFFHIRKNMCNDINTLLNKYHKNRTTFSTLQSMLRYETMNREQTDASNALLWLTRVLRMIVLFFQDILVDENNTENLVPFLQAAYEKTIQKHHGWVTRQMFYYYASYTPTRKEFLKILADGRSGKEETTLKNINSSLINLRDNIIYIRQMYNKYNLGEI